MKKIIVISLILLSIAASAFLAFDSSDKPSNNNEGIRKPNLVLKN